VIAPIVMVHVAAIRMVVASPVIAFMARVGGDSHRAERQAGCQG
jgi:hypothetical protein